MYCRNFLVFFLAKVSYNNLHNTKMSEFEGTDVTENTSSDAAYGKGDRKVYYQKWDKFANEAVKQTEEEEKSAKDAAVTNEPVSEAQKRDLEKRAALKEAKKAWDGVTAVEASKKVVVGGESNQSRALHMVTDLEHRGVLVLKDNTDCQYELPEDLNLIKIFVENCKRCVITLNCRMKTSCLEISHCSDVTIIITSFPTHTIQIDMCDIINILYKQSHLFTVDCKIYHSHVSDLTIEYVNNSNGIVQEKINDYELYKQYLLSNRKSNINSNEDGDDITSTNVATDENNVQIDHNDHQQFVTQLHNNVVMTNYVLRDRHGHPITQLEIDERKRLIEQTAKENNLNINDEVIQKMMHEYDPVTPLQQCLQYKEEGNKAFKELDYIHANVYYTQGVEFFRNLSTSEHTVDMVEVYCTILSNRAASLLKLGDHTNALNDTEESLKYNPQHLKSIFRKGLALHALGRYREACPVLGLA